MPESGFFVPGMRRVTKMPRVDPLTGLKICTKCEQNLPADLFARNPNHQDGLQSRCRECCNKIERERYQDEDYKERRATKNRAWQENNPERMMWISARSRAHMRAIPHTITVNDIYIPDKCPICERPLKKGTGKLSGFSPSLDVYDPALGYIPGNIWVICFTCNRIKQDMTGEEHVVFGWQIIEAFKKGVQ